MTQKLLSARMRLLSWCFIILSTVHASVQDNTETNTQEIVKAIENLKNFFEHKMEGLLEEKFLHVNYRLDQLDAALVDVKADLFNMEGEIKAIGGNCSESLIPSQNEKLSSIEDIVKVIKKTQVSHVEELLKTIKNETGCLGIATNELNYFESTITPIQNIDERCLESEGFFMSIERDQCFKVFPDPYRTWTTADSFCKSQGLELALPYEHNAVDLQKYLNENGIME